MRPTTLVKRALSSRGIQIQRADPLAPYPRLEATLDLVAAHRQLQAGRPLRFVQIGAYDGVTNDPLHHLIRKHGWAGTLVEPQPRFYAQLQANYQNVDGLTFLNAAVAQETGTRTLYTIRPRPGLPEWVSQTASFTRELLDALAPQVGPVELDEHTVQCVPIRDLIQGMDLVQIDVEGYDAELVRMIDLNAAPPIIRFEHKHLPRADHDDVLDRLAGVGYLIHVERDDTLAYRATGCLSTQP